MDEPQRASPFRAIAGTTLLLAFSVLNTPLVGFLAEALRSTIPSLAPHREAVWDSVFLVEALFLCAVTWRGSGLGLGDLARWRRFAWPLAIVFAVPPLLAATVYAAFTSKPFSGMSWSGWLLQSSAQEFFFTGFVYGLMCRLHGAPTTEWRSAVHPVHLLTALCFMAWHWPNARVLPLPYVAFQGAYTFLGACWTLQMRRWTGAIWPNLANHVLVNWLAAIL